MLHFRLVWRCEDYGDYETHSCSGADVKVAPCESAKDSLLDTLNMYEVRWLVEGEHTSFSRMRTQSTSEISSLDISCTLGMRQS
jgi:hypothetical protein